MVKDRAKQISEALIVLAELLTEDDFEITASDLLENIVCRSIDEEDAEEVERYLDM